VKPTNLLEVEELRTDGKTVLAIHHRYAAESPLFYTVEAGTTMQELAAALMFVVERLTAETNPTSFILTRQSGRGYSAI